jgi:hypothetical protein
LSFLGNLARYSLNIWLFIASLGLQEHQKIESPGLKLCQNILGVIANADCDTIS